MNDQMEGTQAGAADAVGGEQDTLEPPSSKSQKIVADIIVENNDWQAFGNVNALVQNACDVIASCNEPKLVGDGPATVTVALSTDERISELNREFRNKSTATNVLSFPATSSTAAQIDELYLGDIIIAAQTTLDEARTNDISPAHHLQHLVVHAVLHLLGYDHENKADALEMEELETKLLAGLNISNPYESNTTKLSATPALKIKPCSQTT